MALESKDTISAIATAAGDGGIGIIRLSGAESIQIASGVFKSAKGKLLENTPNFTALYGQVKDEENNVIDEALCLVMRAPHSYTAEDVVEIHCHGGAVPLRETLRLTIKKGARLAQPGEFTKRAFLNGRIDLTQAEAVIDVIRAKTDAALKSAVNNLSGHLSKKIRALRTALLMSIAHLEAAIDFPEEDIEEITANESAIVIEKALLEIGALLAAAKTGKIYREGLKTAIIGKPNVGKSSLLNALVGDEKAIVTEIAGTTRDVIEEYINIEGIPLRIMDTAGIRQTGDLVERIGVDKAKEVWQQADLSLLLIDSSAALSAEDLELLSILKNRQAIVVLSKGDLEQNVDVEYIKKFLDNHLILKVSVKNDNGLTELKKAITELVHQGNVSRETIFVDNVRQFDLLEQAKTSLEEALRAAKDGMPIDCIVVDIRIAYERLGEITGETVGEDIIEQIFSQFCIGK